MRLPPSTIFHCWQKTGILVQIDRSSVGRYDQFLSDLPASTKISVASLLNHDDQATASQSEAVIEEITEGHLNYVHNYAKLEGRVPRQSC